jgi:tRNA modification GTPase
VGEERAIVTSVAGTTRDVLEESVRLHGVGLNVIDTAGIRDTEDEVEKIGVDKARKYAANADLIIYVVDGSRSLDENDDEIINLISDKKVIVLMNKTDLEQVVDEKDILDKMHNYTSMNNYASVKIIRTSTKENTGIDEFENTIRDMFFGGEITVNDEIYITNQRHKEALKEAYDSMNMVLESLRCDMPEDFYSIDLMSAYSSLGRIIGEEVGDDLVNEIFSKFCMGK